MEAWVYKSRRKPQTYLYVNKKDDFGGIPNQLLELLGELELVLSVHLHEQRKLAQVEAREVMACLRKNGYFLQLPPPGNKPPDCPHPC